MPETAAIIGAAARFVRAWTAATEGDEALPLTAPAVIEAHDAARELIRATHSKDLVGAYAVVDALVHGMN